MNLPSERMWKPTQMTIRLATMPSRRSSISRRVNKRRNVFMPWRSVPAVVALIKNSPIGWPVKYPTRPFPSRRESGGFRLGEWRLLADRHFGGGDALADLVLGDPTGIDHRIEIVFGDRNG